MVDVIDDVRGFVADRPWGARDVARIDGASVRLHWTDQPYKWHVNDGAEVFVVLDGEVLMKYKEDGAVRDVVLGPTDMFIAQEGDEHVAHPNGPARILVIEREGSV